MRAVNKVKVKLLVSTAYQGPRKEGEVFDVPEDFARRWVKNGIAEYASKEEIVNEQPVDIEEAVEVQESEVEEAPVKESVDYSSMSAKDLYALCKEKNIDVEAKKSKEYYIEKLAQ